MSFPGILKLHSPLFTLSNKSPFLAPTIIDVTGPERVPPKAGKKRERIVTVWGRGKRRPRPGRDGAKGERVQLSRFLEMMSNTTAASSTKPLMTRW